METNHSNRDNREEAKNAYHDRRDGSEETSEMGASDRDVSGNDRSEEARNDRRHHQQFGNRKYESHTNHSSADDQPRVNTGPDFS